MSMSLNTGVVLSTWMVLLTVPVRLALSVKETVIWQPVSFRALFWLSGHPRLGAVPVYLYRSPVSFGSVVGVVFVSLMVALLMPFLSVMFVVKSTSVLWLTHNVFSPSKRRLVAFGGVLSTVIVLVEVFVLVASSWARTVSVSLLSVSVS